MRFSLFFIAFVFGSVTASFADTFKPGKMFNHSHSITFECEKVEIYRVKKEYTATGGIIVRADDRKGKGVAASSIRQRASFERDLSYFAKGGEVVKTYIDFYSHPENEGTVTSKVTFFFRGVNGCSGRDKLITKTVTSVVKK